MRDVVFYDTTHTGPVSRAAMNVRHIGGANVATVLLAEALAAKGLDVDVLCADNEEDTDAQAVGYRGIEPGLAVEARRLIVQRFSTMPPLLSGCTMAAVAAHDFGDARHDHLGGLPFVCVSNFQAKNFRHLGATHVIPPIVDPHVWEIAHARPSDFSGLWAYASEAGKGRAETERAWEESSLSSENGLNLIEPKAFTAADLVTMLAEHSGLFYRNAGSAECFPVVVAIARALGLKLDVACVGHERCGLQEAADIDLERLRPEAVADEWIRLLKL